jgi:hypothetical protein
MTSSGDETGKKERMARNFQVSECNGELHPLGISQSNEAPELPE